MRNSSAGCGRGLALPEPTGCVVIDGAGTSWFEGDLALAEHPAVAAVVFPKAEPGSALSRVAGISPYLVRLGVEWDGGCRNGAEIWHQLRAAGFRGSVRVVAE